VRDFTGTQWLRAQDITLEARVNPALGTPSAARIHFDTNVPAEYRSTAANTGSPNAPGGLWLPAFSARRQRHRAGTQRSRVEKRRLRRRKQPLALPLPTQSDPKVKSISTLEFFFTWDLPPRSIRSTRRGG
jgi:hypothetical protein